MLAGRWRVLAVATAIGLLASGCLVENEHSIIDTPISPDARLAGVWALEAGGTAQVLLLKHQEGKDSLEATFVVIDDQDPPAHVSRASVSLTTLGGRLYYEAFWKTGEWLRLDPPVRRSFGTVELLEGSGGANDRLKVCHADTEAFEVALESGALSGYGGAGKSYERRMLLASDGAELRTFLAKNHFKCSVSSLFRRVSGPAQER